MFVHSNFDQPTPPKEPFQESRAVGLAVLVFCFFLCLLFVIGVDATVLVPFNATRAVTQTWEAQHPQTATPAASSGTRSPRPTPRARQTFAPNNPYQQADAGQDDLEAFKRG